MESSGRSEQERKTAWLGANMDGPILPIVNAVTPFEHPETKENYVLGLVGAAFDERPEQT